MFGRGGCLSLSSILVWTDVLQTHKPSILVTFTDTFSCNCFLFSIAAILRFRGDIELEQRYMAALLYGPP